MRKSNMPEIDIYMTVKDLKRSLNDIPDDYKIYYQRIEDIYFNKHGWKGKKIKFYDSFSEYIRAFSAYPKKNNKILVINGHY